MRDLNLGPDTARLVQNYRTIREHPEATLSDITMIATQMGAMLERWITVGWCWPDCCPAAVCGGPHVTVHYEDDRMGSVFKPCDVVEPYNRIGTTFPEVPYRVVTNTTTGRTRRA